MFPGKACQKALHIYTRGRRQQVPSSHMNQPRIDVLGIGNAIVDIVAEVDESFLADFDLAKDTMHLVDHGTATRLLDVCEPVAMMSGGSVANTIAGLAAIGGSGGFVGRVKDDVLGQRFAGDLNSQGVVFAADAAAGGPETGRSLILVTPDGHRTMCTWLGASVDLGVADLAADAMPARVVLLEGYLMDAPEGQDVFAKAASMAAAAGCKVAMSLSDAACVDRHRDFLHPFLHDHVDIVFANEAETLSLFPGEVFCGSVRPSRGRGSRRRHHARREGLHGLLARVGLRNRSRRDHGDRRHGRR